MKTQTLFISLALLAASSHGSTIAYWNLPEADDVTLTDLTGNGNNLVSSTGGGNAPFNQSANVVAPRPLPNPDATASGSNDNNSIYMNGRGEAAHVNGTSFQMTSTSSFTMEGWFLLGSGGVTQYIAGDRHQNNAYRGWFVNVGNDNRLQFYSNSGGTATNIISSSALSIGQVYHFAAVWDHTASTTGQMALYLDGAIQGGGAQDHAVGGYTVTDFVIGGRSTSGSTYDDNILTAASRLDELRFSNQALSSSEFLNAVPEPSAWLLSMLGCMILLRRRRN